MGAISFEEARSALDLPAWYGVWQDGFDASASWADREDLLVPERAALAERCERYRFPESATRTLVEHRGQWDDPFVRRLGAHVQWLISERYTPSGYIALGWPPPFTACPLFYAYTGLGLSGRVESQQRGLGIPGDVTASTLWDLGQQVMLHARIHGEVGMPKGWWVCHHLASHLFRLGRLQFQRGCPGEQRGPIAAGECFLDVHIPEDGPLDPGECDASFAVARRFFPRFFPEERPRWLACSSWLLDPVLREILPEGSKVRAFQDRFEIVAVDEKSSTVFEFVFDRPDLDRADEPDLRGLSRETGLERAIIRHYEGGGRIGAAMGVIPFEREAKG